MKKQKKSLSSLDDDWFGFGGSYANTIVTDEYESRPYQRAFTFFKEDAFLLKYGVFGPPILDEAVPHEMIHQSGVGYYYPLFRLRDRHDLVEYPPYENILNNCMCPEEDN